MKFKVGQIVKWRGHEGTILSLNEKKKSYRLSVHFGIIETHESQITEA
jgi:hypothetical protein